MELQMNEKTRAWIRKNGAALTLDPYHPFYTGKKPKRSIDTMISYESPEDQTEYNVIKLEDVTIYVNRSLNCKPRLKMHVYGFFFQQLHISGVQHFRLKN